MVCRARPSQRLNLDISIGDLGNLGVMVIGLVCQLKGLTFLVSIVAILELLGGSSIGLLEGFVFPKATLAVLKLRR